MHLFIYLFAVLLAWVSFSSADGPVYDKVWGAVVYTFHGESVPYGLKNAGSLTSLGANQLYGAGNGIRSRYVQSSGSEENDTAKESGHISGISETTIVNGEIGILSTDEQAVSASALAFAQGLYPPESAGHYGRPGPSDDANYVNGSLIRSPLSGYQYPALVTAGAQDPASIHLGGHAQCPKYAENILYFGQSPPGQQIRAATDPFYEDLYNRVLKDVFARENVNYFNAPFIFDYLDYENSHNETARHIISQADLDRARALADENAYGANANYSAVEPNDQGQHISAVAGMTLADYIIQALEHNIHTEGTSNKLSLLFGGFEPMVAFSALLGLPSEQRPNFYGRPNPGASMVIELFSRVSDVKAEYPESDTEFMVRFLLRNGTHPWHMSTPLTPFPMFGRSAEQSAMPYKEFVDRLVGFRLSVSTWCRICASASTFCSAYKGGGDPDVNCPSYGDVRKDANTLVGVGYGVIGLVLLIFLFVVSCANCRRWRCWRCWRRNRVNNAAVTPQRLPDRPSLPKQPQSFEMTGSGSTGRDRTTSSTTLMGTSTYTTDDEEHLLSPATQPVLVRETV